MQLSFSLLSIFLLIEESLKFSSPNCFACPARRNRNKNLIASDRPWLEASSFLTSKTKVFREFPKRRRATLPLRKNTRSRSTSRSRREYREMPKQLQSRHSTYHSSDSDISWAMLCMYISQCARRDGIEHGSIINIFLFIISCLRFDGSSHFISRSTFAELHQNGNCANGVSSVGGVIVRMRRSFLSFIDLNRRRQLQSKAPCSLRLI